MNALGIKTSNLSVDKYSKLYNSVPCNKQEMDGICHEINGRLCENMNIYKLSIDDVEKAVKRFKLGKSDGEEGLSSDSMHPSLRILLDKTYISVSI